MITERDRLAINSIRILSAEAVQKAASGHPGLPMGAATMAFTLWDRVLRHNPVNPSWPDRDRFVLSAGHGSMLLYSLLHITGYDLSMEDIRNFRQMGSRTPGHPEYGHTPGVETTTGPLGQGLANGVGMAIAETRLAREFNRPGFPVIDHFTYVLAGDGCMMEGITSEAASLAGTLGLGKLVVLYDDNRISIEGSTDLAFREDVSARYRAYGWQVIEVTDGEDSAAVLEALEDARKDSGRPSLIRVRTIIGYGSPAKQGTASAHGEPLGEENLKEAREKLGWKEEPFHLPAEVVSLADEHRERGRQAEEGWHRMLEAYFSANPEMRAHWERWFSRQDVESVLGDPEFWRYEKEEATRSASGVILNRLAGRLANLMGGSADLAPSTKTLMKDHGDFSADNPGGSNLRFGVREHAMAAIANGMALHGGLIPYVSTFFVFTDYMRASMRLSALMGLPVIYILTHDSIGVGEDGPTHQPVEHLMSLRAMPGIRLFRPADSRETAYGWKSALEEQKAPTVLVLTRQNLPLVPGTGEGALRGGYVLRDSTEKPQLILMGSGSEISLLNGAWEILTEQGIPCRLVSLPCWELFENQSPEYRESVLPSEVTCRISAEAGVTLGWERYAGSDGVLIGLDHFGASAPGEELFRAFGFTPERIAGEAERMLDRK